MAKESGKEENLTYLTAIPTDFSHGLKNKEFGGCIEHLGHLCVTQTKVE